MVPSQSTAIVYNVPGTCLHDPAYPYLVKITPADVTPQTYPLRTEIQDKLPATSTQSEPSPLAE